MLYLSNYSNGFLSYHYVYDWSVPCPNTGISVMSSLALDVCHADIVSFARGGHAKDSGVHYVPSGSSLAMCRGQEWRLRNVRVQDRGHKARRR